MRHAQGGQAIVEFGIVALLFTAIMFAIVDLGLLLNTWLAVSSGSRDIARSASVGKPQKYLLAQARQLNLPSVSTNGFSGGLCCGVTSAIEVQVQYFASTCLPLSSCTPYANIVAGYPLLTVDNPATACGGSCHPQTDDLVVVTVIAHGAQVITPLMRPFFGCTDGSQMTCNVNLKSTTIMRFEGLALAQ